MDVSSRDWPTVTASVEEGCEIHKPNYHNQSRQQQPPRKQTRKQDLALAHHPVITRLGPGQNPQYNRAHFGEEAVGCSPTPQHTTMSPRKRSTITTRRDENNGFCAGTPTPASFNLVLALAAKRVALGKSQTIACLDVSIAFLHAKMKDEVFIKLDAGTLRMMHEENMTNLKPFDDEGSYRVDKALYGHRGSPRYWKDAVAEAAKELGLKPSKIDNSLYLVGSRKFHLVRACGRRASLGG